jgi:protein-tyrosine phosphatase
VPYWGEMEDGEAGYIHTVAVSREWKGHQIGRKMIAWAEGRIREKGRRFARLDCSATFQHYYEAAGYRQVGVREMGDWEAQLMEKEVR